MTIAHNASAEANSGFGAKLYALKSDETGGFINADRIGISSNAANFFPYRYVQSGINERGVRGTWQTLFRSAGDFYAVQPMLFSTRDPSDATYTSDDIYDSIGVSPTAAVLNGGLPDATAGAWVTASNVPVPRQAGASITTEVPVAGPVMVCPSIARTDGGPGRLLMARVFSTGPNHALAATTRMPTYFGAQSETAVLTDWDGSNYSLAGECQHYLKANSTDYAGANQAAFGAAAPTRTRNTIFAGMKFFYAKPCLTVMGLGDSIMGGDYVESGVPIRASYLYRAGYALQLAGRMIDTLNFGVAGAAWDRFGPIGLRYAATHKPDVVLLPGWTPNGVNQGTAALNTVADAQRHLAMCAYYRQRLLDLGVKKVIIVTPLPEVACPVATAYILAAILASGFDYFDAYTVVEAAWGSGTSLSVDGSHPTAAANVLLAAALDDILINYTTPA